MQVLMVCHEGKGGLQSYTDALCGGLCKNGVDVTVLGSSLWPATTKPYKIEKLLMPLTADRKNLPKVYWATDRLWRGVNNSLSRNRFATAKNFDVVHLQLGSAFIDQILLKPLRRLLPVVLTVHDVQPHFNRFSTKRSFLRRYFHIPHRLIVHHDNGKKQLVEDWGISADRIDVIPHGIMPVTNYGNQKDARRKLNISLDRKVILFFGSIRRNKGLDVLLKALKSVRLNNKDILLVIAGSPPRGENFESYSCAIEKLGLSQNVQEFVTFINEDDVDRFFAASDLVVMPYLKFESQSGILLRAYAHQKPVVVSNIGAMGELVLLDKVGSVVEPGKAELLAEAIINVLNNIEGYQAMYTPEIKFKYDWKLIAGQTILSYKKAINFLG